MFNIIKYLNFNKRLIIKTCEIFMCDVIYICIYIYYIHIYSNKNIV